MPSRNNFKVNYSMTYLSETAHPAVLTCTLTQWTDYYSTSLYFYSVAVLVILFNTKLSIVDLQTHFLYLKKDNWCLIFPLVQLMSKELQRQR